MSHDNEPSPIRMARAEIDCRDVDAVVVALRSKTLSLGEALVRFESGLASYAGTREAVAVSSGTAALHLALLACDLPRGSRVITTPLSFVASANVILFAGLRPVFVDVDPETGNLDPRATAAAVAISPDCSAVLAVHLYGRPCEIEALDRLCFRQGLALVEDACESIGSRIANRMTGSFGRAGTLAFFPNKQMTSAEGGAILTNDPGLAARCRALRNQGRRDGDEAGLHAWLGHNYRMSELHAALGASQLGRIESFITRRQELAGGYRRRLSHIDGLELPTPAPANQRISWFTFVVRVSREAGAAVRDRVIERLARRGIESRAYFRPIHLQPYMQSRFGFRTGDYPVAEDLAQRSLALPLHPGLGDDDLDRVAEELETAVRLS